MTRTTSPKAAARKAQLSLLGGDPAKVAPPRREDPPEAPAPAPAALDEPKAKPGRRATAESMATKQREISISEFFTKNRHLLGFDNP